MSLSEYRNPTHVLEGSFISEITSDYAARNLASNPTYSSINFYNDIRWMRFAYTTLQSNQIFNLIPHPSNLDSQNFSNFRQTLERCRCGGGAIFHTQFAKNLFQMFIHRAWAHLQDAANFPVGFAVGNP